MRALVIAAALLAVPAWAADLAVPDPALTPGAWRVPSTPLAKLCAKGYTRTVRNVPARVRDEVFRRYGHPPTTVRSRYEVDHLVPLELDGTNAIENLWPEPYPRARRKDVLENALRREVCAGKRPLREAQTMIARDWREAYALVVVRDGR